MVTKTRTVATDLINGVYGNVSAIFAPFSALLANETAQIVANTIVTFASKYNYRHTTFIFNQPLQFRTLCARSGFWSTSVSIE